jgi:hypothetical protein
MIESEAVQHMRQLAVFGSRTRGLRREHGERYFRERGGVARGALRAPAEQKLRDPWLPDLRIAVSSLRVTK